MNLNTPLDVKNAQAVAIPSGVTNEQTYDATISSATDVTLTSGTKWIEVTAIDKGIFMKWATTVTNANFDEFIPLNTSKLYEVPQGVTIVSFLEQTATAILVLIEKL